jgi:hypothetical protein
MGYVTEYKSPKVTIIWHESDDVCATDKENVIKTAISLAEFKHMVEQYEKQYGKYGYHWTTILNNESNAFGLEYIDRGFNN